MTSYRLVTAGHAPYTVSGSTTESGTDPSDNLAVAALHRDLANTTRTTTKATRIQHRDPRSGSWINHDTAGLA